MCRPFSCLGMSARKRCKPRTTSPRTRANAAGSPLSGFFSGRGSAVRAVALTAHHTRCRAATSGTPSGARFARITGARGFALTASLAASAAMFPGFAMAARPPQPEPAQNSPSAASDQPAATAPVAPPTAAPAAPVSTEPPAPDVAMTAYKLAESWIRAGSVDEKAAAPELAGVSVTLRHGGKLVGRGADTVGGPGGLARAVMQALQGADERLPVSNDALREESLRLARQQLCIGLELAGPFVPYGPRYYDQVDLEVQAGIEGVAARQGDRFIAMFPWAMLVSNTTPGDALAGVISSATGDPTLAIRADAGGQPGKLAKDHQLTFYRFKVTQLAQPGPGLPPVFLFRGGRVVSQNDISVASLREFADGLAEHLMARKTIVNGSTALQGTAWPVQGTYNPALAPPLEQALAALALRKYAARSFVQGHGEAATRANDLADELVRMLATAHTAERPLALGTAALSWVAVGEAQGRGDAAKSASVQQFRDRCSKALDEAAADAETVGSTDRAVVAWALASRLAKSDGGVSIDAADAFVRAIYRETPPAMLVSQMPWLGWAELALTAARRDREIKSATALRDMRVQIWEHQLTPEDCGTDGPDLVGGIVFTASRNPLPTWPCIRPLTFTATMLGEPGLTDDAEVAPELARLLSSLRFVRQLAADEATGHLYADPARARWGIRSALWDQRQPPEATAMALLMVCETMESLEKRTKADAARPPTTP